MLLKNGYQRRLIRPVLVCVAVVIGFFGVALPSAATTTAETGVVPAVATSHVSGCGSGLSVRYPVNSDAALTTTDLVPRDSSSVLKRAITQHVRWLKTLSCKSRPDRHTLPHTSAQTTSGNWSGYVAWPTNQSSAWEAQMMWSVPPVSGDDNQDYLSIWPGIGQGTDLNTDELIQAGTQEVITPGDPSQTYFWFEAYPLENEEQITNLIPYYNDSVGVNVDYDGTTSYFTICDYTQNVCGQATQATPPPTNSAEMIAERPGINCTSPTNCEPSELADFGSLKLSQCYYDETTDSQGELAEPISDYGEQYTMIGSSPSDVLAQPSLLDETGAAFTDVWHGFY